MGKLEDLLSTKLDQISVIAGTSIIFIGLIGLSVTNLLKAMRNLEINFPEITIISAIMVLVGFQIAAVGLLTRLVLQVRSEVSKISTISSTKNEESLKTSIVVKEELHD